MVSHGNPVAFVLTRPLSLAILVLIGLSIYYALRPKSWEKIDPQMQKILDEEEQQNEKT